MGGIGSATSAGSASTLTTDEAAAKIADAASTKATSQLDADEKTKAGAIVLKSDQANVKSAEAASQLADAKVQSDESGSGGINISA